MGWEGVGLVSYLLVGFLLSKKNEACDAAIKSFIVNRVGDTAYIVAMLTQFTPTVAP